MLHAASSTISPAYIASPAHTNACGFLFAMLSHRLLVKFWLLQDPNAIRVDSFDDTIIGGGRNRLTFDFCIL
jgi:hypothetical protein